MKKGNYELAHWGGHPKCRNCGKEDGEWMKAYRLFNEYSMFGGNDELIDTICVDCFKNPAVDKIKKA